MSFEIGPLNFQATPQAAPARPAAAQQGDFAAALAGAGARRDVASVGVPSTPPPDALVEVQRAAQRAADLAAQNRELHFSKDEDSGRIVVEVRDLEGNVIRRIPPSHALAVMSGAAL
jgi:flagellar protein FlaG